MEWETNFRFNYYEIIKIVVHFALCTSKADCRPILFEGTVTGDSYVKMLDEEVFPSILNETNDFVLLYALKCDADHAPKFRR